MATEKNELMVIPLTAEDLNLPEPPAALSPATGKKVKETVENHSVRTPDGKTGINAKGTKILLNSDDVGAKKFMTEQRDKDKFKSGGEWYIRTPALRKEIDNRIEKPYDAQKREHLRYASTCLVKVRDNQESERDRSVEEVKIRKGQRTLKSQKIARDGVTHCERSGEPLAANAEAHHTVRRADDPDKALDLDNIELLNPEVHTQHHEEERRAAKA